MKLNPKEESFEKTYSYTKWLSEEERKHDVYGFPIPESQQDLYLNFATEHNKQSVKKALKWTQLLSTTNPDLKSKSAKSLARKGIQTNLLNDKEFLLISEE